MMNKSIVSTAASLLLVLGAGIPAHAVVTVNPAEGGWWMYSPSNMGTRAESTYYHPTKCHGATLKRNGETVIRTIQTHADAVASAAKTHAPWTTGWQYYYWLCSAQTRPSLAT